MRALALLAALFLVATLFGAPAASTDAGGYDTSGPYSRPLQPGPHAALPWEIVDIPSAIDGKNIHFAFVRPDTDEPVPVLVDASPYFGDSIEHSTTLIPFLEDNFVEHGYAVAGIAVRGTSYSGGCIEMFGPSETADLSQAITWLASQPWSNGNVGMYGSSYEGTTPWAVAGTGNPHVKAIVPMNGIPSLHDLMFRNGTAHSVNGPIITSSYYAAHPLTPVLSGSGGAARLPETLSDAATCPDGWGGTVVSQHATLTGEDDDALGYWRERDHRDDVLANYRGAVLSVMGLEDWNVDPHVAIPFSEEMRDVGIDVRQLHHRGGHWWPDMAQAAGNGMRWDWAEMLLRWFDEHLKDGPAAPGNVAEVQSPDGRWWALGSYPPRDAERRVLHLTPEGVSSSEGAEGATVLTPQGWNGDRFTDITLGAGKMPQLPGARYEADVAFDAPTLVSGLPRLHATVTPTAPTGHLTAWLLDVAPDGSQARRAWAQMNLEYADGSTDRKPIVPGVPLVARMQFEPIHFVVEPGHALRLRVWQYSAAEYAPGAPAPILLHHGAASPSVLELPILARPPQVFPPGIGGSARIASAAYDVVTAPTAMFAVERGETLLEVTARDATGVMIDSFFVCQDADEDGACGGPGELAAYACYSYRSPIGDHGAVQVTVLPAGELAPAGSDGWCPTGSIAGATVAGSVQVTFTGGN